MLKKPITARDRTICLNIIASFFISHFIIIVPDVFLKTAPFHSSRVAKKPVRRSTIPKVTEHGSFFLKILLEDTSSFCGQLIPLFWTSGEVCPRFQSQGGSHACMVSHQ